MAYGDGVEGGERPTGVLDDYVFAGHAAQDAWEATGEMRYFEAALALGCAAVDKFYDRVKGGFFDTERAIDSKSEYGALCARRKPLQDAPSPGGNPVAAALLLRLTENTADEGLRGKAEATLECFAGMVEHLGLHCATYALALRRSKLPPVQVVVVGMDSMADELERAALRGYAVNKSVVRLRQVGRLPLSLAETIPNLPRQDGSFALVCRGFTCGLPLSTVQELASAL